MEQYPDGPASPPPRPEMSYSAPAPIAVNEPPPATIKSARALWLASFVVGAGVLLWQFLSRDTHLERLQTLANDVAPGNDVAAQQTAVGLLFWGILGMLTLVILLEMTLLGTAMRQRGWAPWALFVMLLIHGGATYLAAAFLVPDGEAGSYTLMLWAAQFLLAVTGLLLLVLPASTQWFRSRRRT